MSKKQIVPETSKISSKGQVTVPVEIRNYMLIEAGDNLGFFIENEKVILKKVEPIDLEYYAALGATLNSEWGSKADEQAYGDL